MQALDYEIADDSYYLFAVGELTAREEEFIDDGKLKRMASTLNIKELLKLLRETYYSKYAEELEQDNDFDKVVSAEFKHIAGYLQARLKEEHRPALNVMFIPEEIHNYKVVAKALAQGENLEKYFVALLYPYSELLDAAKGTRFFHMDQLSQHMAAKAAQLFGKDNDFRRKEFELEKHYLQALWEEVKKFPVRMILDYFKCSIDMYNIKNVYRHWLAEEKTSIQQIIAPGGFLGEEFYKNIKKGDPGDFFKQVKKTRYRYLVTKEGALITEHKDYSTTEKNEDIFYRLFFNPVKYTAFNLEKVFNFFLKKKLEIKTLNIIYNGILYGMDKDRLRHEVLILDEDKDRSNR